MDVKNLALLLVMIGSNFCFGQEENGLLDTLAGELVITHSRFPISLKSAYKQTVVIDQSQIKDHATDDISTLLDQQAGISVNSANSNPGKDKSLFLQGAAGEFTLILVDGVPVTDPSGIGGSFDLRSFSLALIERIEIIKGGQSVLYGSDAVAGVINLITKQGVLNASKGQLNASFGSFGMKNISGSTQIPIHKNLQFQVDASHASSNGISEALDVDNIGFDKDGFNRNSTNTALSWRINSDLSIRPYFRYSAFNGDYDGGAFTDGADDYESSLLQTGLSSTFSKGNVQVNFSYVFNKTDRTFNSALYGISDFKGRFHHGDLYGKVKISEASALTLGVNMQDLSMKDERSTVPDPSVQIFSPYVSFLFQPDPYSILEAGSRYNNHDTFGSNLNYSIGGSRWLNNRSKIYAYWATSFKAPNLFQLYGQFGANPDLLPQKGHSFNIGVSLEEMGVLDELGISFFDRRVKQLIAYDFSLGYRNISEQHDQGIEIFISDKLGPWRFGISYGYLFGEIDEKIPGGSSRENLYRRPKHQIDGSISYHYKDQNKIKINLRYAGERNDLYFDTNTFSTESVLLDRYWVGHLYADYLFKSPRIKVFTEIRNLFDADFEEVAGFSTIGRSYFLGISLNIGS